MEKLLLLFVLILTVDNSFANDTELKMIFEKKNVNGSIVIASLKSKTLFVHNKERAERVFLPASTFKILNTLIALEEKVVVNAKEVIKWDGKDKGWKEWNRDQSIETAFPISCVWFFQELAKRIGKEKYATWLTRIKYGNGRTGNEVTTFWLDGDLRISLFQQIEFLEKLYEEGLPFQKQHYNILKKLMIVEKTPHYTIRAKTGWAQRVKPQYGWYVGYVQTKDDVWFFATNIEIRGKNDRRYRKKVTMEALKQKGIL